MPWPLGKLKEPVKPKASDLRGQAAKAEDQGQLSEAFVIWLRLAEDGDASAAHRVGDWLERGHGVLQSFTEAVLWFRKASDAGIVRASARLGDIYFAGRKPALAATGQAATPSRQGAFANLAAKSAGISPDYPEAAKWNLVAAEAGDPKAQVSLAYQFASGLGVAIDYAAAERWFSKAATQDDAAGQLGLGMILAAGHGREKDLRSAAKWFEKASDQGNTSAKVCLAVLLGQGVDVELDYARAVSLLTEAAEARLPEAMFLLGEYRRIGIGCEKDESEAETWLRRAALSGHIGAMVSAGSMLRDRENPDFNSAAAFFREAADRGNGEAQVSLAELYIYGRGVPKDGEQATQWFEKAAVNGVASAYQRLGAVYADGLGSGQDFAAAAEWFGKAAEAGQHTAYYSTATLHHYGLGVPVSPTKALKYYKLASDNADWRASLRLGILHAQGELVKQDWDEAARYYGKAAAQGSSDAELNLAFIMIRGLGGAEPATGLQILVEAAGSGNLQAAWSLYKLYSDGAYIQTDVAHATKWLLIAAEGGSHLAIAELGRNLVTDTTSPVAPDHVVKLLEAAARAGDPACQSLFGRVNLLGKHVKQNAEKALLLFSRAAQRGDVFAQAWLGDVLATGQLGPKDPKASRAWYWRAAEQGHLGSLLAVTSSAPAPGVNPSEDEMISDLWEKLAASGEALAQRMIGDFRVRGVRCQKSVEDGVGWLRKASSQGNNAAKLILAGVLLNENIDQNHPSEALNLLEEAAASNNVEAMHNLGVCFRMGIGLARDHKTAAKWYRLAALRGHPPSQLALGDLLIDTGTSRSFAEALSFYHQAAGAGLGEACLRLGRFHEAGLGKGSDPILALPYFQRAAEVGLSEGIAGVKRCLGG